MINSKRKGAVGERQWRDKLREHGFRAKRGQQFAGGPDSPDVLCEDLPGFHWEVKRVERLNLEKAMEQAARDCGLDKIPVVAHRVNNGDWRVTMNADNFLNIIKEM